MSVQLFAVEFFLCFLFLWGFTAGEDAEMIPASPGNSCILKCTAKCKPGVQYLRVRWYRVGQEETHYGLLTKTLPNGMTKLYANMDRDVKFVGDSYDMILSNVSCSDQALFACYLSAPVGEQNQEGRVQLNLKGCPDIQPKNEPKKNYLLIIIPTIVLITLLAILCGLLKIISKKGTKTFMKTTVEKIISLNAPLKPLNPEDLKLIHTLGLKAPQMNV